MVNHLIGILTADDHPVINKSLKDVFDDEEDMTVIDSVTDSKYLLSCLQRHNGKIDVLIADVVMPSHREGLEAVKAVVQSGAFQEMKIIFYSSELRIAYIQEAIGLGINGYLCKGCELDELVGAVREVTKKDEHYFCSRTKEARRRFSEFDRIKPKPSEMPILFLLNENKKAKEISKILNIKEGVVQDRIRSMRERCGVDSIVGLLKKMREIGIIQ